MNFYEFACCLILTSYANIESKLKCNVLLKIIK